MLNDEKIERIKQWLGSGSINVFGLPLSGKDTQCKILANILDGNIFGGGEIIRDKDNDAPEYIALYTRDGLLPPSDDFLDFVLPYLKNAQFDGKPLLLSSLGRWHGEEEAVIESLNKSGHPQKVVIYLAISTDESDKRRKAIGVNNDRSDRSDDTGTKLSMRFDEFNKKTLPVLDYYRKLGLLTEVDGTGSREEVTSLILEKLYNKAIE